MARKPTKPKPAKRHPHVEAGLEYAKAVVAGEQVACRWVRLACRRHLDDLKAAKSKTSRWVFDATKADRVCQFAELFPHVKGHWAIPRPGDPASVKIRLEPWQCFWLSVLFGWVERATGLRRFRTGYVEVPRKNAKSVIAAIIGLYMLAADGEAGAEVYSGATTEKQAWEVFRPAKQMADKVANYRSQYGVQVNAKGLIIADNGSRFEPVIGKPGDGASPSLAIVDEYHEHLDSVLYDTMVTGMGARQQPLTLVITTAGSDTSGPCYALHKQVEAMLDGSQPDDRVFGLIYTVDEEDDWTSPDVLAKANPNFGVSVNRDYLEDRQREAVAHVRHQTAFKTKHLNQWVSAHNAWLNMEWWNRQADTSLRREDFAGQSCWVGVDLSSRIDMASVCSIYRREVDGASHFYAFWRVYSPENTVNDPSRQAWQAWAGEGHLVVTDGDDMDYQRMVDDLMVDCGGNLESVQVDPWNSRAFTDLLIAAGVDRDRIIEVPQNVNQLSGPTKDLEACVKAGRFHHAGDPCVGWQFSNVVVREDAKGNVYPRKDRRELKIDAALACILAMVRAGLADESRSIYENQGLTLL